MKPEKMEILFQRREKRERERERERDRKIETMNERKKNRKTIVGKKSFSAQLLLTFVSFPFS